MKNLIVAVFVFIFATSLNSFASPSAATGKVFTMEEIRAIADGFVNNNLGLRNPAIADVDGDGNFDILMFKDGNIEYYRNQGTNAKPDFVPENMQYDKYKSAFFMKEGLPYPIFFADKNGDGKPDMFVIKDKVFNPDTKTSEYKVLYAENSLDLDTGTLVTIILVLIIVILVLAILK